MGIDSLLQESEPHGFTEVRTSSPSSIPVLKIAQPLSLDQEFDKSQQLLLDALALLNSQQAQMNPDWHAKFRESGTQLFNFIQDNIKDENHRTLLKTNDRGRHNEPLLNNVIGRYFGTFMCCNYL